MIVVSDRKVTLEKSLNELDKLVLQFVNILRQYTDYVIVSGYVAILFGRSRGTEDVDIFIRPPEKEKFILLYHRLKENGFWCLNAESDDEVYSYLQDGLAIRFARHGETIPNFEIKFTRKRIDEEVFSDYLEVQTAEGVLRVSSAERQIAFKRYYLKSPKDLEDAQHIENLFKEHIQAEKVKKYKELIELTYGKT